MAMAVRGWLLVALPLAAAGCARSPANDAAPAAGRGAQLYLQNCVPCHHEDARGVPGVYPSLAGSAVATGDPAALARWVLDGERPDTLPAGRYATRMLRFGWMTDSDAAALLSYVRGSFGNQAAAVDARSIAQARSGTMR